MPDETGVFGEIQAVENKAIGWVDDLLTRGGRRLHAAVVMLAVPVMCVCCVILTIASARAAFRAKADAQNLQIELLSAYGTLSALVGYVYKKGKQGEAEDDGSPHSKE